jgi:hypothetical protein
MELPDLNVATHRLRWGGTWMVHHLGLGDIDESEINAVLDEMTRTHPQPDN